MNENLTLYEELFRDEIRQAKRNEYRTAQKRFYNSIDKLWPKHKTFVPSSYQKIHQNKYFAVNTILLDFNGIVSYTYTCPVCGWHNKVDLASPYDLFATRCNHCHYPLEYHNVNSGADRQIIYHGYIKGWWDTNERMDTMYGTDYYRDIAAHKFGLDTV